MKTTFALLAGGLFLSGLAAAQTASIYVVHGIPGTNGFPVDVQVTGPGVTACPVQGLTFGEIRGPLALPAGSYVFDIKAANAMAPCSGATALSTGAAVSAGASVTAVAHLTAGAPPAPTVSLFVNAVAAGTAPGAGRVTVHHTAAAPAVDVSVQRGKGSAAPAVIPNLSNGNSATADLLAGNWFASLAPAGSSATVFGPAAGARHNCGCSGGW